MQAYTNETESRDEINLGERASLRTCERETICTMVADIVQHTINPNTQTEEPDGGSPAWMWASLGFYIPLAVFGVVGNIMAIIIFVKYIKKTTTTIFIIALAVVDLIACSIVMPIWFAELISKKTDSEVICKLESFLKFLAIPMSGSILMVIALDRFLLIFMARTNCITPKRAKIILFSLIFTWIGIAIPQLLAVSTLHSIPAKLTNRICEGEINCMFACRPVDTIVPRHVIYILWQGIMILFLLMVISFTLCYGLIFIKVYCLHQKMKAWRSTQTRDSYSKVRSTDIPRDSNTASSDNENMQEKNVEMTEQPEALEESATLTQPKNKVTITTRKRRLPHLHTALTLSFVTVTFILAYAPMILIMFTGTCKTTNGGLASGCDRNTSTSFIWNLCYLNHITNPIIYSFMNPRFKEAIRSLLLRKKKVAQPS